MKNLLIASTSTIYGGEFLAYLMPPLRTHFKGVKTLLFIPYARPGGISYDGYTEVVRKAFEDEPILVKGIYEYDHALEAIERAEAIFVGGGNTFVLIDELQKKGLIQPLRNFIDKGRPYLGTSAGSNITGLDVKTTNDMPIVHPASLDALAAIPFNINPHYLDPDPDSKHNGETRETRIKEFHCYNDTVVIGLREGSWIDVKGDQMLLKGDLNARIFKKGKNPFELPSHSDLRQLL